MNPSIDIKNLLIANLSLSMFFFIVNLVGNARYNRDLCVHLSGFKFAISADVLSVHLIL